MPSTGVQSSPVTCGGAEGARQGWLPAGGGRRRHCGSACGAGQDGCSCPWCPRTPASPAQLHSVCTPAHCRRRSMRQVVGRRGWVAHRPLTARPAAARRPAGRWCQQGCRRRSTPLLVGSCGQWGCGTGGEGLPKDRPGFGCSFRVAAGGGKGAKGRSAGRSPLGRRLAHECEEESEQASKPSAQPRRSQSACGPPTPQHREAQGWGPAMLLAARVCQQIAGLNGPRRQRAGCSTCHAPAWRQRPT